MRAKKAATPIVFPQTGEGHLPQASKVLMISIELGVLDCLIGNFPVLSKFNQIQAQDMGPGHSEKAQRTQLVQLMGWDQLANLIKLPPYSQHPPTPEAQVF